MNQKKMLYLLIISFLFSCDNESADNLDQLFHGKDWKISFYSERSKVETEDYSEYIFSFEPNGKVLAIEKGDVFAGSWKEGNDDSTLKLIITFENPYELEEISEDWQVITKTNQSIELYHKSGGDGHESFLTFEKK